MHKIDGDGATVTFTFTEGNPSLSVPATVVTAAWANAVQGELVTVIESAGLTLLTSGTDTEDQLYSAILELIKTGGTQVTQAVANNTGPADVTGFPLLDTTIVKTAVCRFDIFRRSDSSHVKETGNLYLNWDSETSTWVISLDSKFDDAGVVFTMALDTGTEYKLQYTSGDLTGASYSGTLRITDIKDFRV